MDKPDKIKAIFFDRDGVVNFRIVDVYINNTEQFKFTPDFLEFFTKIKKEDWLAILITNQQGIEKGLMTFEEMLAVFDYMQLKLKELTGFAFDDIYYCTSLADSGDFRRKPNPGMILEALEKWNIDPQQSWMLGDRNSDVIAGKRAGLKTILLGIPASTPVPEADYKLKNMNEAYELIQKTT